MLVFVAKPSPKEDRERGEEDKWRIEKDVPRLSEKGVLEDEEQRSEESSCSTAIEATESEIGERDCGDSKSRRDHAHSDIWCIFVQP